MNCDYLHRLHGMSELRKGSEEEQPPAQLSDNLGEIGEVPVPVLRGGEDKQAMGSDGVYPQKSCGDNAGRDAKKALIAHEHCSRVMAP